MIPAEKTLRKLLWNLKLVGYSSLCNHLYTVLMLFEKRYLIGNNFLKKKFFREDSRILSDNLKLTFQNLRPISSPQGFEKENRNQFW